MVLPTLQLQGNAKERRRDFRHVVSAFLDLVSMNLAGGRGIPEALQSAVGLSNGWGMVRIRETLQDARLQGITPWSALGDLGEEMAVEELRDLAAALALVAEDGAKVRESLSARAVSMRQRELADAEGRAAQRSQSMLVAQLLLSILASMIVMWFSRRREFRADAGGAQLAGRQSMIGALRALQRAHEPKDLPGEFAAFGISGTVGGGLRRLFLSHPPLEERIEALQSAAKGG